MAVHERYVPLGDELIFMRHSEIRPDRAALLFIHGLGESSLCFVEAFSFGLFGGFNLVAPDQVGYGRSSRAFNGDYSFAVQIGRLRDLVSTLGLKDITLIGHSMGGILATLWAGLREDSSIRGLVNVEGNLASADATFSRHAAVAFETLRHDFERWCLWFLSEFSQQQVFDLGAPFSVKRYYASLLFARPKAFLANALEIIERTRTDQGEGVSEIGHAYRSLRIPRIYFWGQESLADETRIFLHKERLRNRGFSGAGHWPMIDAADEFYPALADFLGSIR